MLSLISSLYLKLYLNSLVYDRNIIGSSSKVFGNFRKFSENVRQRSCDLGTNFGESSEISLVRYCSCHSNINFISSRHRVISFIYHFLSRLWEAQFNKSCNLIGSWSGRIFLIRTTRAGGICRVDLFPGMT